MPTAFIFHGTAGHPGENWFPWLKGELERRGFDVIVPQFPTPEGQMPETWFKVLEPHLSRITADSLMFGHSLGGTFLLRVLEHIDAQIRGAFFVASPVGILPIKNYATDKPFLEAPFDRPAGGGQAGLQFVGMPATFLCFIRIMTPLCAWRMGRRWPSIWAWS